MSFLDWIRKQEDKDRCGRWPFNLPRWFPFTEMCKQHDVAYEMARSKFLKRNSSINSVVDLGRRLKTQQLESTINIINAVFYARMRKETDNQPWYRRTVYRAAAKFFQVVVERVGYRIWRYGTIQLWMRRQL